MNSVESRRDKVQELASELDYATTAN